VPETLVPTPTADVLPRRFADFATLGEALDYAAQGVRGLNFHDPRGVLVRAYRFAELRRGYGERRVTQALKAAGIGAEDAAPAREEAERSAEEAALRFARRRRIGPYAEAPLGSDRDGREARRKAAAAMLRAGHRLDIVRRILDATPGDIPDPDLS